MTRVWPLALVSQVPRGHVDCSFSYPQGFVCACAVWEGSGGEEGLMEGLNGSLQNLGTGRVSVTGGPTSVSVLVQPCPRLSSLILLFGF